MPHPGQATLTLFSPDSKTLFTASEDDKLFGDLDHSARLWDWAAGTALGDPMPHDSRIWSAAFSPDGRLVATGTSGNVARIWDARTGKPRSPPLPLKDALRGLAFSPDGGTLLTWSDRPVLWDVATAQVLPLPSSCLAGAVSPDFRIVLVAEKNRSSARFWDRTDGKFIGPSLHHQGTINGAAFSPDGKMVVTAGLDGAARLWDVATFRAIGPPLPHPNAVNGAVFSPDGGRLLTVIDPSLDGRLWETPRPLEGEVERIVLWTQVLTGMRMEDAEGGVSGLSPDEWRSLRRRLEEQGGPPMP